METIEPTLQRGPLDWVPLPTPPRRSPLRWAVPVLVLAVAVIAAVAIDVPYYAIAPGTARPVGDLIVVPAERSNPPKGRLLLSTVSLRRVSALEAVQGWLDGSTAVVPEEQVLGSSSNAKFASQNLQLMDDSKSVAIVVALRRLGFDAAEEGKGGLVTGVDEGSPAAGSLSEGDVIVSVDGAPTPLSQSVVERIRAHKPGDRTKLEVSGVDGAARTIEVVLGPGADPGAAALGVSLRTKEQRFAMPFPVSISSDRIGGPSAGLAFTLGLLDTLTPGELTGGRKVAVTGTIDLNGNVGDVGGVAQKTAAVRAAGAQVFLVPPGEFKEAVARAGGDIEVRQVASLDQAVAALEDLGGDPLRPLQSPPAAKG